MKRFLLQPVLISVLIILSSTGLFAECLDCVTQPELLLDTTDVAELLAEGNGEIVYLVHWPHDVAQVDFLRSVDAGLTWSVPIRIDSLIASTIGSLNLAADGTGTVYAVWVTSRRHIRVRVSPDQGVTWPSPEVMVAAFVDIGSGSGVRLLAAPGGQAWIFWRDGASTSDLHLWITATTDSGANWSPPVRVDSATTEPIKAYSPVLEPSGGLAT
ncbi:sialidase family protein, partial [Acidobacteriota bacterium]